MIYEPKQYEHTKSENPADKRPRINLMNLFKCYPK